MQNLVNSNFSYLHTKTISDKLFLREQFKNITDLNVENIKLVELVKMTDKKKWLTRFMKTYNGQVKKIDDSIYGSFSKFFVAVCDDKQVGFIRLTNYSDVYAHLNLKEIWSISEAYVKPCYRNKGVLRKILKTVIQDHNVKMLRIETKRLIENSNYYATLGFTKIALINNGYLSVAYTKELESALKAFEKINASNDPDFKLAA